MFQVPFSSEMFWDSVFFGHQQENRLGHDHLQKTQHSFKAYMQDIYELSFKKYFKQLFVIIE